MPNPNLSLAIQPISTREGRVIGELLYSATPYMVWSIHVTVSCHMTHYINVWLALMVLKGSTKS